MKKLALLLSLFSFICFVTVAHAQDAPKKDSKTEQVSTSNVKAKDAAGCNHGKEAAGCTHSKDAGCAKGKDAGCEKKCKDAGKSGCCSKDKKGTTTTEKELK